MQDTLRVLYSDSLRVLLFKPAEQWWQSTEWLALVIALLAVIIGPWISSRIAKRQIATQLLIAQDEIKAAVLSGNRKEWIDKVQKELSQFQSKSLGLCAWFATKSFRPIDARKDIEELHLSLFMVALLLNPEEKNDHRELLASMQDVQTVVLQITRESADIDALGKVMKEKLTKITLLSRKILSYEWERVKTLK